MKSCALSFSIHFLPAQKAIQLQLLLCFPTITTTATATATATASSTVTFAFFYIVLLYLYLDTWHLALDTESTWHLALDQTITNLFVRCIASHIIGIVTSAARMCFTCLDFDSLALESPIGKSLFFAAKRSKIMEVIIDWSVSCQNAHCFVRLKMKVGMRAMALSCRDSVYVDAGFQAANFNT